ncbi:MAG: hypothetical protein GF404_05245 [candidate division Zixibacteria bacterium]|nr:hypothetical protein [candidate division Zixibacteria bacterium]
MRREIPLIITAVAGIAFVVQYFIPHTPFNRIENLFTDWLSIIAACAIWLGALNLLKLSILKVAGFKKDWFFSLVIILAWMTMAFTGILGGPSFQEPGTRFDWLYTHIYTPLSATMFAMLAFYVASASYRAFRARNFQATLLLVAAFMVLSGRVLFDELVFGFLPPDWKILSTLSDFIMQVLNTAGQRAILIGIALGTVSTSLRIILGIERSYLGSD